MTGMPAARLGLKDRGILRKGAKADVVVFSPERVADAATYESPHRYAEGIAHVVVNGRIVIKDAEHTGSLPGRVLKSASLCAKAGPVLSGVTPELVTLEGARSGGGVNP